MSGLRGWIGGWAAAAALVAGGIEPAAAAMTVTVGNQPADAVNVVANGCVGAPLAGANQVYGCLEADPSRLVSIVSNEAVVYSGGQATISAVDGAFSTFSVSMVDGADLTRSVVNIDALNGVENAYVRFSAGGDDSAWYALDANGQNFFTLIGDPTYTVFTATTALGVSPGVYMESQVIESATQLRLASAVPEPETVAMMLAGLGVLGVFARRRNG